MHGKTAKSNFFADEARPLVTIGIPTFNRAHLLIRAINSACQQKYQNLEIVISDNFSSDRTEALCRAALKTDHRIRYLRQPENMGPVENFRNVLDAAQGEFFMWLGDDDWIDLDYIEKCLHELDENPTIFLVSGTPRYYRKNNYVYEGRLFDIDHALPQQRLRIYYSKVTDNGIFYGLFRTTIIRKNFLYDKFGGDWHFIAQVLINGGCKMIKSTAVHRELGGASESYQKLIRYYGLPQIAAIVPSVFMAWSAARCMAKSPSFLNLPHAKFLRLWLIAIIALRPIMNIPYRLIKKLRRN